MANVKVNFIYNSAYQLLKILVPIITAPYLARVLSPSEIGEYSYTFSVASYFILFAMLGMQNYGSRAIAKVRDNKDGLNSLFWEIYCSQAIIGCFVFVLYLLYVANLGSNQFISLFWLPYIASSIFDISWFFFGVEEFRIPVIRNCIIKLLNLAAIFLFVHQPDDLWRYILITSLGFFFTQASLWPFLKRYVSFQKPRFRKVIRHIKPNLALFIPVIAISLYTNMDKVMLGLMSSMEQTGYYEYAEKITKIPLSLITALGAVMLPHMSNAVITKGVEERSRLFNSALWFALVLSWGLAFGISGLSGVLAPVFLGSSFVDCAPMIFSLAAIIPFIAITNTIGYQYLLPNGKDSLYTLSVIVGAVVNIASNIVLIPFWGGMGAVYGTIIAEASVMLFQLGATRHDVNSFKVIISSLPFAVLGIINFVVLKAIEYLMGFTVFSLVSQIIIGVLLYCGLSLTYCLLTKNEIFYSLVRHK